MKKWTVSRVYIENFQEGKCVKEEETQILLPYGTDNLTLPSNLVKNESNNIHGQNIYTESKIANSIFRC